MFVDGSSGRRWVYVASGAVECALRSTSTTSAKGAPFAAKAILASIRARATRAARAHLRKDDFPIRFALLAAVGVCACVGGAAPTKGRLECSVEGEDYQGYGCVAEDYGAGLESQSQSHAAGEDEHDEGHGGEDGVEGA